MERGIRFSTRYLGVQMFTFFINGTGWDSIGFSFPFWLLYLLFREMEKQKRGRFLHIGREAMGEAAFLIAWAMLNAVSSMFYFQEEGAVKIAFYYLVGALFFISIVGARLSEAETAWLMKMYVRMAVLASLLLFLQRAPVPTYTNRLTVSILGHTKDPNYFSAYLMFPCLACLHGYIRGKGRRMLAGCVVIAGAILLTGSRSSFLALAMGALVIMASSLAYQKSFARIFFIGLFAIGAAIAIFPDDLIRRLIHLGSYNDGSNRLRYNIWMAAIGIWKEHWILGRGQNVVANHGVDYGALVHMMTHSTWLDILAEFGLAGLFLFLSVPMKNLFRAFRQKNMVVLAAMVATLATATIISAQYSQYYWLNMALACSLLACGPGGALGGEDAGSSR